MAILVSNPSTVQFTGAPNEPQDPAATLINAGFTEELANAMQPLGQDADGQKGATKPIAPGVDPKLSGLQILPPDVLLNAVGEANFALSAQGQQAPVGDALLKESVADITEDLVPESMDSIQAAEMAAAVLAAQMSAPTVVVQPSDINTNVEAVTVAADITEPTVVAVAALVNHPSAPIDAETIETSARTQVNLQASRMNPTEVPSETLVPVLAPAELQTIKDTNANAALNQMTQNGHVAMGQTTATLAASIDTHSLEVVQSPSSVIKPLTPVAILATGPQEQINTESTQQIVVPVTVVEVSNEALQAQVNASNFKLTESDTSPKRPESVAPSGWIETVNNVTQTSSGVTKDIDLNVQQVTTASASLNLQKTVFEIVQSDVAKPDSERSFSPEQATTTVQSDANQTSQAYFSIGVDPLVQDNTASSGNALSEVQTVPQSVELTDQIVRGTSAELSQETSFKFDAKLGANVSEVETSAKAKVATPVSFVSMQIPASLDGTVVSVSLNASSPQNEMKALSQEGGQSTDPTSTTTSATVTQTGATQVVLLKEVATSKTQVPQSHDLILASRPNQPVTLDDFDAKNLVAKDELPSNSPSATTVTTVISNAAVGSSAPRLAQNKLAKSTAVDTDAVNALAAVGTNLQTTVAENTSSSMAVIDNVQPSLMSFSDVSSTFVNTLVGGPQRPLTTVMDWVALKPQEPPRPVMPHELRLDAGAVQVEIQRMVKQGGGHVVMELTPPDQSKFTIELKLDEKGGAYLKVEGISDSTKTRLEQSAPQLQEQFQQMGLNLQLDMRQNRDSSQTDASNWTASEPKFDNSQNQEATPQNTRAVAAERARKNNGGQIYLYA